MKTSAAGVLLLSEIHSAERERERERERQGGDWHIISPLDIKCNFFSRSFDFVLVT